jgi:hypothetical protein
VQKHVNMVNFDEDGPHARASFGIPTSLLVALFVCLCGVIIAMLSHKEDHRTYNHVVATIVKFIDELQSIQPLVKE